MSAGLAGNATSEPFATMAANVTRTNGQIDLLWIACGTEDGAVKGARALRDTLASAGIEHTYVETPGGHYWNVWRRYLRDVAPLLFK